MSFPDVPFVVDSSNMKSSGFTLFSIRSLEENSPNATKSLSILSYKMSYSLLISLMGSKSISLLLYDADSYYFNE